MLLGPQLAAALSGVELLSLAEVLALLARRPFFLLFAGLSAAAAFWRAR